MSVENRARGRREQVGSDLAPVVGAEELDQLREEDGDLKNCFDVFNFVF